MKKLDKIPDRTTLVELLQSDPIGRNADLEDFAEILKSLEGGFSLFLDADWGSGKTFFIKQVILLLEEANPLLESHNDIENLLQSNGALVSYSELNSYLPVYYNAWENDHWDDPLPSIAAAIAHQGDASASIKSDTETCEKIIGTLDAILKFVGRGGVSALVETFSGKDLIQSYRERVSLRSAVSDLVDAVLPEKANTLLLVVDELDRCRPSFAMKVLEQLKNLFTDDRVVAVYSVNASQLAHVVEGMYGQGFDGQRYLSRFYDLTVPLRKVDSTEYSAVDDLDDSTKYLAIGDLGHDLIADYLNSIVFELAEAYAMPMRDINRYLTGLFRVVDKYKEFESSYNKYPFVINDLFDKTLIVIVLAMKLAEPDSYRSVVQNLDPDPLYNAFAKSKKAIDIVDFNVETKEWMSEEKKKEERLKFLEALIYIIWCPDKGNPKFQESRSFLESRAKGLGIDLGSDESFRFLLTII